MVANNAEIAGRVSLLSSCAAVTFTCSSGFTDDEGHGTATASIAAGQYGSGAIMSGVAPSATILSEKALNASGSGYDTDIANGIMNAANAGAPVISLSLTYIPSAAIVSAINYATSRGAVIVWAGGNASSPLNNGANTYNLTPQALSHIILVGSVDSTNTLSSFSNTPGPGSEVSGSTSASYASLWLMAPGENIVAPGIQFGAQAYAYWSGTSMSTPEVAGAVALLEATWPALRTNGTAPAVLFASATDLGTPGVDSTYGNGLLNITKAFQPIGTTSVLGVGGQVIPVGSGGGTVVASGALGSLSAVQSVLSRYTIFDVFQRNFTANLSHLIVSTPTSPNSQPLLAAPVRTTTTAVHGGRFTLLSSAPTGFASGAIGADPYDVGERLLGHHDSEIIYLEFSGNEGEYFAFGRGASSTLSFTQAAWGSDTLAAEQASSLGVTSALVDLAQGGFSAAVGGQAFGRLRMAMAWSSSPQAVGSSLPADRSRSDASAIAVAFTAKISQRWSLGATLGSLKEDNALLGTTYAGTGAVSFGAHHRSRQVGFSTAFDLGGRRSILAEATIVDVDAASLSFGLVREVSPLRARAYGVSFIQGDVLKAGDFLSISLRKPLRIVSGHADLAVTSVDGEGVATTSFAPVSLAPSGSETDLTIGYAAPMSAQANWRAAVTLRKDAGNQAGRGDVAFRLGVNWGF